MITVGNFNRIIKINGNCIPKEMWDTYTNLIGDIKVWFTREIATNIVEDSDRQETIYVLQDELDECGDCIQYLESGAGKVIGFVFHDRFKEEYFAHRMYQFKKQVAKLEKLCNYEAFCNCINIYDAIKYDIDKMIYAYVRTQHIYVDSYEHGFITLDDFIRDAKEDTPYYICGTKEYYPIEHINKPIRWGEMSSVPRNNGARGF